MKKMKDIAIYGAGGLGREIACIIKEINRKSQTWNLAGFFDDSIPAGRRIDYGVLLGGIDALNGWKGELSVIFGIASPAAVSSLAGKITKEDISFPNIISPDVTFLDCESIRMGKGNYISSRTVIGCNVSIGNFNSIGVCSTLGHDCTLGDFNVLMPSVQVCGNVEVGQRCFLGINSVVLQQKKMGNNVTLGAGSILMANADDDRTYFGNPARPIMKK